MRPTTGLVAALFSLFGTFGFADAVAPDWKCAGQTEFGGTDGIPKMKLYSFYLASEVKHLPNHHLEIWMKGVNADELEKIGLTKEGISRAAKRLVSGYRPPITTLPSGRPNDATAIIALEEAANEGTVRSRMQMLVELDCENQMSRMLSIIVTSNGKVGSKDAAEPWEHIPPEGTTSILSSMVCRK